MGNNINLSNKRLGEINYNRFGSKMTIIEYTDTNNIIVEFENRCKIKTSYSKFKIGSVSNPYDKTIFNIGFIGVNNIYNPNLYSTWSDMLRRCYDPYYINKELTYKDCTVCEEWHNLQNFTKWYEENYYEIDNEKMCLDKDILYKGNKIYSPSTCVFVPQNINNLLCKSNKIRGVLPIGVFWDKQRNKYQSKISIFGKTKFIGRYNSIDEAFNSYKQYKEKYIKEVADKYKDKIPLILYDAMYRYSVDIND